MDERRYVIVRVDNVCPARINNLSCNETKSMLRCKCGKDINNYGDTVEQFERKLATGLRRIMRSKKCSTYDEVAKQLAEYLGVK